MEEGLLRREARYRIEVVWESASTHIARNPGRVGLVDLVRCPLLRAGRRNARPLLFSAGEERIGAS